MTALVWMATLTAWVGSLAGGLVAARRWEARARTGRPVPRLAALRGWPMVLVFLGLSVPFLLVARVASAGEDDGGAGPVTIAVILSSVLAVAGVLFLLGLNLAGHDPDANRIARRLSREPVSQQLLTRWLARARWRRWLGGFLGVLAGLFALDNGSGWGRLLVLGLGGILVGSASAELHHLRPARDAGPRAADLTRRHLGDYTERPEQRVLALVAVASLAALGAGFLGAGAGTRWWAGAALAVVVVVMAFQWRIVIRPRPALPAELRAADDLLRRLAVSRGVARPGLALGLALLGQASAAAGVAGLAALCWLAALAAWWLGRRLGLDRLLRQPVAAL